MRAGRIAVLCLADVPDGPILGRNARTCSVALREPEPGVLWTSTTSTGSAWVDELVRQARHPPRPHRWRTSRPPTRPAQPAVIFDVEGLDFLEKKLERLEESYARGVRTMQLVHYTPNDLGDFQTGAVVHHGLTPFGADVIRACNKLGVVVDVAHATADTVKQAAKVATRPLLLSHTALRGSKAQGVDAAHRAPDHPRSRAGHRGDRRLHRHLALLRRASSSTWTGSRRWPTWSA